MKLSFLAIFLLFISFSTFASVTKYYCDGDDFGITMWIDKNGADKMKLEWDGGELRKAKMRPCKNRVPRPSCWFSRHTTGNVVIHLPMKYEKEGSLPNRFNAKVEALGMDLRKVKCKLIK